MKVYGYKVFAGEDNILVDQAESLAYNPDLAKSLIDPFRVYTAVGQYDFISFPYDENFRPNEDYIPASIYTRDGCQNAYQFIVDLIENVVRSEDTNNPYHIRIAIEEYDLIQEESEVANESVFIDDTELPENIKYAQAMQQYLIDNKATLVCNYCHSEYPVADVNFKALPGCPVCRSDNWKIVIQWEPVEYSESMYLPNSDDWILSKLMKN